MNIDNMKNSELIQEIYKLCTEKNNLKDELELTKKKLGVAVDFLKDFQITYKFVQKGNDSGHYDLLYGASLGTLKQIEEMK